MRKVKKRAVGVALFALLSVAVAACGGGGGEDTAKEAFTNLKPGEVSIYCTGECAKALAVTPEEREVKCKVGVSWSDTSFPYGAAALERTREAAKDFPNMEVFTTDGQGDAVTQSSQVEDLVAKGIEVLVISALDEKSLAPAVEKAEAKGVKVIASDRNVAAPVETYVGADNVEDGEVAGEYVVELLDNGKGNVVLLQGSLGASPTIDRGKGFKAVLSKSPGAKIIAEPSANYDRQEGLSVMQDMLQRFGPGEIDVVFAENDEMSLGAIQAIREADRQDEIKVVGIDGQESALRQIKAGQYAGTVVYPLPVPEHLNAAAKICSGEQLPERIKQAAPLVTEDNVAKYEGTTF
ncbi:MAG: substrate-binding domain-containing protein [Solirubrobacterales bacterium]